MLVIPLNFPFFMNANTFHKWFHFIPGNSSSRLEHSTSWMVYFWIVLGQAVWRGSATLLRQELGPSAPLPRPPSGGCSSLEALIAVPSELAGWRAALLNTLFRWLCTVLCSIDQFGGRAKWKGLRYSLGRVQPFVSLAERPEPCLGVTRNEFSLVSTISSPCALWVLVSSLVWG